MKPTSSTNEKQPKQPRHVAIAQRHLLAQREKAISVRDKAANEVKELDAALLALGWTDQLSMTAE